MSSAGARPDWHIISYFFGSRLWLRTPFSMLHILECLASHSDMPVELQRRNLIRRGFKAYSRIRMAYGYVYSVIRILKERPVSPVCWPYESRRMSRIPYDTAYEKPVFGYAPTLNPNSPNLGLRSPNSSTAWHRLPLYHKLCASGQRGRAVDRRGCLRS
jgi:hypothetical protein